MKSNLKNFLIRILGSIKRFLRLERFFFKHNKNIFKYGAVITAALVIIVVSAMFILNIDLDLSFFKPVSTEPTTTEAPSQTTTPTSTPIAHIYGNSPLIILDCSEFNDSSYISQTAETFGTTNDLEGMYFKVEEWEFIEKYNELVESGTPPNVLIAPNDILLQLGEYEDITDINEEVLFNNAAMQAVKTDRIPIALEMYGYFFRVDLLYVMSRDVPRLPQDLLKMSEVMRSDYAYSYLRYNEDDKAKADRRDEFETSRYGFGFPGGDVGGELFLGTSMELAKKSAINIMYDIEYMWEEIYLPPDTIYADDETLLNAYFNDALCGTFTTARLYEKLLSDTELLGNTQIKPFMGEAPIFSASAIYCAIPSGSDAQVAKNFLSILYNGGNLDKIIAQNHTAYLPVSLFYNQYSPWVGAYNEDALVVFYEQDYYLVALKHIILAGEDVETALSYLPD